MSVTSQANGRDIPGFGRKGRVWGTSGGVGLSLATDERSKPPPFWAPPLPGMRSSSGTSVNTSISPTSTTTPAGTRPLNYVRKALGRQSSGEQEPTKPYVKQRYTTQSTPSSPALQQPPHWYPSPVQGRGAASFIPPGKHHDAAHLDARAAEFVPGRGATAPAPAAALLPVNDIDLNECARTEPGTAMSSSRVSVRGSRSPSLSPSTDEGKSAEREREEAERQWHLQAVPGDEDNGWGVSQPTAMHNSESLGDAGESVEAKPPGADATSVERPALCSEQSPQPSCSLLSPSATTPQDVVVGAAPPGFGVLIHRARMIRDDDRVPYPKDVIPPNVRPANTRYAREFLLQFEKVCTGKPPTIPTIDPFWHLILVRHEQHVQRQERVPRARTVHVGVQTEEIGTHCKDADSRDPEDTSGAVGCDPDVASQAGTNSDATTQTADAARDLPVKNAVRSVDGDVFGKPAYRVTPRMDELDPFDYEMQDARRELLEAQVARLEAEMKIMHLELCRLRRAVGIS
ncbi:hypothetical protein DICSQDRAFT_129861 [Dichomitus squalens LYAD-421 SS1]|uniref:Eukaryotic translation initiation factor 4G1 eIF4E-binding domain-containing protein n=1 Tax=Dichomitus squalens (strain LYAD-421) TaxID=732165 RepID=R7SPE2_DICSQ|nr:uncharacterized protein DICSQDRAFT_129861 [Dichomitus squalens LYAD-421 SS1]EJF56847.1 hypothetical protein DICSQDRAFT_129861 [Dichomitus squalens LYAD-421 SS1]